MFGDIATDPVPAEAIVIIPEVPLSAHCAVGMLTWPEVAASAWMINSDCFWTAVMGWLKDWR